MHTMKDNRNLMFNRLFDKLAFHGTDDQNFFANDATNTLKISKQRRDI